MAYIGFLFALSLMQVPQKYITHNIYIEREPISLRIAYLLLILIRPNILAIIGSYRIAKTTGENFAKCDAIFEDDTALYIDIKLRAWFLLRILQRLFIVVRSCIIYRNKVGLISTCPDHKVSRVNVWSLLLSSFSLNKFYSLFGSISNRFV